MAKRTKNRLKESYKSNKEPNRKMLKAVLKAALVLLAIWIIDFFYINGLIVEQHVRSGIFYGPIDVFGDIIKLLIPIAAGFFVARQLESKKIIAGGLAGLVYALFPFLVVLFVIIRDNVLEYKIIYALQYTLWSLFSFVIYFSLGCLGAYIQNKGNIKKHRTRLTMNLR